MHDLNSTEPSPFNGSTPLQTKIMIILGLVLMLVNDDFHSTEWSPFNGSSPLQSSCCPPGWPGKCRLALIFLVSIEIDLLHAHCHVHHYHDDHHQVYDFLSKKGVRHLTLQVHSFTTHHITEKLLVCTLAKSFIISDNIIILIIVLSPYLILP